MTKTGTKCKKCSQPAAINMRQHKLALCGEHFLEWVPQQVQRFIEKYEMFTPDDKLLVAVSGGKDSLSLWDILLRLGYQADGLYIGLGIDGGVDYSHQSHEKILDFIKISGPGRSMGNSATDDRPLTIPEAEWDGIPERSGTTTDRQPTADDRPLTIPEAEWDGIPERSETTTNPLTLHVVDIAQVYGESIPQVAARTMRGRGKPCSVCGLIKRHVMNRVARDGGYGVLATGHNLDDEAAVLFGNTLNWQSGYLLRQAPVLPSDKPGLARKVKPLCRMYEREMAAYALVRGIDYIYDECPYALGSTSLYYKELLNQMEHERPGAKLQFYLGFLKARKEGLFAPQAAQVELVACSQCGQPTSAPGKCAFCRLWPIPSA